MTHPQAAQYKTVPTQCTIDMSIAFAEVWYSKRRAIDDDDMQDAYQALIDAAPPAPASQGEVAGWRIRHRSEPGMLGHYPWSYTDRIRGVRLDDKYEYEPLYTAPQQPAQGWQPIASAPKDGSMILLGREPSEDDDGISTPGFWQEGWEDSIDDMGCDSGFVDCNFQIFNGGRSFGAEAYRTSPSQPTVWQPLPPAPGTEPAQGQDARDGVIEAILDAADEWAGYVEVDTAPMTLRKYLERAMTAVQGQDGREG